VGTQALVFTMSTTVSQFAPKMSWRERQILKEKQQRETAQKAADEVERRRYANTEENFPTLVTTAHRIQSLAPQGFADLANKMRLMEEAEAQMEAYRKGSRRGGRRMIYDTMVFLRRRQMQTDEDEEEDVESVTPTTDSLEELYPQHGRRGRSSEIYWDPEHGDGWRMVTKKMRKQKRELTEAELAQKYREEFFGEGDEDDADMNGDLAENGHRRQFY
jgi:hypothetical protein